MTDKEKLAYLSEILNKKIGESKAHMDRSREERDRNMELIYLGRMVAFEDALGYLKIVVEMEKKSPAFVAGRGKENINGNQIKETATAEDRAEKGTDKRGTDPDHKGENERKENHFRRLSFAIAEETRAEIAGKEG